MLVGVLCVCGAVSALQITNVKLSGQAVPSNFYGPGAYTTNLIISRALFEKNPTVSFDVIFDTVNANSIPEHNPLDSNIRYRANILIGGDLYNAKNVWLGSETGNYRQVTSNQEKILDPWYSPYLWKIYSKGEHYIDSIPLTPGQTHYTYTLQNPEILCFDAHVYSISIFASAYDNPSIYYDSVDDAKWDYTSGDNSDDAVNSIYATNWQAQEFTATQTYDCNKFELKMYRVGVLPAGYSLTVSLRDRLNGPDRMSITYNTTILNGYVGTTASYLSFPFSYGSPSVVRLTKGSSYFIVARSTNFGDSTHKISWRKDSGWLGFPHYVKGTTLGIATSWNYGYFTSNAGSTWNSQGDTFMFRTSGSSIIPSYSAGNCHYNSGASWFHNFIFNTFGPDVDRSGPYSVDHGYWAGLSHYAEYKQNNLNFSTSLFIGNAVPSHMKMTNSNLIGKGASFDTVALKVKRLDELSYTDTNVPITVVLCDKDRRIVDYSVVNSYMPIMATYPFRPYGPSLTIGTLDKVNEFKLLQYTVGKSKLENRKAYYMYIGVPSDVYNYDNTYITTDDTVKKVNWSSNSIAVGYIVSPDSSRTSDFMGCYVYFETQIAYVDTGTAGAFRTTPSWISNLVIWCSNPPPRGAGLPWLAVVIGFLPAIILVGAGFAFMRKFEISLPSYVYSISATGGLYISWYIGLLSLWIFVTMVVSFVFVSIYQFREPISKALEIGKPEKVSSISSILRRREKASEQGVTRRLLRIMPPKMKPLASDIGLLSKAQARKEFTRRKELLLNKSRWVNPAERKAIKEEDWIKAKSFGAMTESGKKVYYHKNKRR